jgi:hypothetical protein
VTTQDDVTRQIVVEHLAAFNAHDTARLLDGFAPQARWVTGQDTFVGTAALEGVFDDGLWTLAPSLEILTLVCDGPRAAAELREVLVVEGEQRAFTIGAFFVVNERGLITSGRVYREGSADIEPPA